LHSLSKATEENGVRDLKVSTPELQQKWEHEDTAYDLAQAPDRSKGKDLSVGDSELSDWVLFIII
jgi:hypothetical protein